jgi:SAM-dependent methyltransferase
MPLRGLSTGFRALLAQGMASFISFQIIGLMGRMQRVPDLSDATWLIVGLHSGLAMLLSLFLRLPPWWLIIQAAFVPAVVLAFRLGVAPASYLLAFAVFWLIFRDNTAERVPLYLSSDRCWQAVGDLLPTDRPIRFLDAGCGLGGGLRILARRFPESHFEGIESAPLPWLYARFMARKLPNCRIRPGNLRELDFQPYDVVYAFLSPQPMPGLWCKVRREMRPGSHFISNSFGVPGFEPDRIIPVGDRGNSRLLLWEL